MREHIRQELAAIEPFDDLEREHLADAMRWVESGVGLFRLTKPASPAKHLVAYFAVIDADHILLVDHKDAGLWLPPGGHVEPGEHPRSTVERELQEELGLEAGHRIEAPLMVTCTTTVGLSAGHVDVSLWYVVRASRAQMLRYSMDEFNRIRWFQFCEVPFERSDPHLRRFVDKVTRSARPGTPR